MRIGIIGGGSIGLLIASYLSSKHNVTIYVKREYQKQIINKKGLFLSGDEKRLPVKTLLLAEIKTEDLLIICVKQTQIASVIDELSKQKQTIPILFLQNGMGHIKYVEEIQNPILMGVVEHGALRETDNRVLHTGKGIIHIAQYNTTELFLQNMIDQLNLTVFPIHKSNDWKELLTEKLIVNAVINPLTTLFNVKNGVLINDLHLHFLAKKICEEVASTLKLDGKSQWIRVKEIAENTSGNISSMLMDMREGRKTEVDAILGYVIERSGEEVPYTLFAYHGIKALEINKGLHK